MKETILVTGGAGYIGSHTVIQLLQKGFSVVILDNFSHSETSVIRRIEKVAGKTVELFEADIRQRHALQDLFRSHTITSVIHFAGLKSVSESEQQPLAYYDNNVSGSLILFEEMLRHGVRSLIFSSSAAVYAETDSPMCHEGSPLAPKSVYGDTKLTVEHILRSLKASQPEMSLALLRYFNPIGGHQSGLIGEDLSGTNLAPQIAQVALGRRDEVRVFGDDYPTKDGTGIRDYIHVEDLAAGHLVLLEPLRSAPSFFTLNLGTGRGYSVLEVISSFQKASGTPIPYRICPQRSGDKVMCVADPSKIYELFGWKARYGLDRMCQDTWRWCRHALKEESLP